MIEEKEESFIKRDPLSAKHEKFCQVYCEIMNGTQAYLSVYPNAAYASASANACRLLKVEKIKVRILELQESLAAHSKQDKNRTIVELLKVSEEARAEGKYNEYARLRDMVVKMVGYYEPEKLEVKQTWNIGFGND